MNGFGIIHAFVHWCRRAEIRKKQWELNDFILAENFSGRHFLASCLRALVEDMRFSIANIDVWARDLLFRLGETRASVTKYRFFLITKKLYSGLTPG